MTLTAISGNVMDFTGLAIRATEYQDASGTVVLTTSSGDITVPGGDIDLGASGTAGTLDIFPTTASKGKLTFVATDSTGNTTTTVTNAAQAGAVTYTIPDAGASANFVMSEGAATINGVKTFGSLPLLKATNAITAFATGGQASAVALTSTINSITVCATAGDSVKLPTATAGSLIQVGNLGAAYANVFPASGDLIDSLAANAAVSLPSGGSLIFTCAVTGSWKSIPMIPVQPAKFTTGTTATTFAAGQLTGAAFVNYTNTQGTPGSLITRTASQMFADDPFARVGATYLLRITNGQGTGTLTMTAGSGVTLTGTATMAVNSWRDFVVTYTSASALVIQNIATGTFS